MESSPLPVSCDTEFTNATMKLDTKMPLLIFFCRTMHPVQNGIVQVHLYSARIAIYASSAALSSQTEPAYISAAAQEALKSTSWACCNVCFKAMQDEHAAERGSALHAWPLHFRHIVGSDVRRIPIPAFVKYSLLIVAPFVTEWRGGGGARAMRPRRQKPSACAE